GEWEITGGMWVESDVNLPSGESLIRQFLHGKRYMRATFGVESNVLWLPDVFGYPWSLPQIIKGCGMKYFMTTKISWSQFNRFPYDTFLWRGLDGTEVLTHFVTTPESDSLYYTYNGKLTPGEVQGIWQQYRQKSVNEHLLMLYGWGDGGGGPTREMLESARVLKNLPGLPSVRLGKAEPYFEALAARVANEQLPVWDGELYLEYHRGTYTSQAQIKRANRRAEVLYHNAEWLSALADLLLEIKGTEGTHGITSSPHQRLRAGWERLLLNQFHDILPGSSIRQVYEDAEKDFEAIQQIGEEVVREAQDRILEAIGTEQNSIVLFNSLSWARDGLIALPWG
ncbi:MAG: alpha-mannosidase, partial [Ardenticatenaceae bacterium]